jgi:hypothetical protein
LLLRRFRKLLRLLFQLIDPLEASPGLGVFRLAALLVELVGLQLGLILRLLGGDATGVLFGTGPE